MKLHALRSISALTLAVLLTACGAGIDLDAPAQTAASVTSMASPAFVNATAGAATQTAAGVTVATSTMPAPDCAADGCKGLRIIDANAEAYRYDAMRRAAADEAANPGNS
jgi:hypothetical protein